MPAPRVSLRFAYLALFAATFSLSVGCASGTVSEIVPIAGGKQVTVPITGKGPPPGEGDGYRVELASLLPGSDARHVYYAFGLAADHAPALRRVQIVDVSDETPVPLVDDRAPTFAGRHWRAASAPIEADDRRLQWVRQITPSLRVYEFTLTANDGHQTSFYHIGAYPVFIKAAMLHMWGEDR